MREEKFVIASQRLTTLEKEHREKDRYLRKKDQ